MGKKDKQKKKLKVSEKKGKKPILWIAGTISVGVVVLLISGNFFFRGQGDKKSELFQLTERSPVQDSSNDSGIKKGKSFYVKGGETRPVLDPSLFTGMAREAYATAQKYPEILDQVYCYCGCDNPPLNHKSLLSCFTDRHGAG